jgi:hypothetical protein
MSITYSVNSSSDTNFAAADGFVFLAPTGVTPSNSTAAAVLNNMLMQAFIFTDNAPVSQSAIQLYTNNPQISGPLDAAMVQYIADNLVEPFVESVRDGTNTGNISLIILDETALQYGDNKITPESDLSLSVSNDPSTKTITITIAPALWVNT